MTPFHLFLVKRAVMRAHLYMIFREVERARLHGVPPQHEQRRQATLLVAILAGKVMA